MRTSEQLKEDFNNMLDKCIELHDEKQRDEMIDNFWKGIQNEAYNAGYNQALDNAINILPPSYSDYFYELRKYDVLYDRS